MYPCAAVLLESHALMDYFATTTRLITAILSMEELTVSAFAKRNKIPHFSAVASHEVHAPLVLRAWTIQKMDAIPTEEGRIVGALVSVRAADLQDSSALMS